MISWSSPASQRIRTIAWLFVLAAVSAGCDQPLNLGVLAGAQPSARGTGQYLEFDLPQEYSNKDANGEFVITGFRLGFFRADSAEPISTIEVGRDAVVVNGSTGKVLLTPQQFPKDLGPVVLRLQTLTRQAASEWSAPSTALADTSSATPGSAPEKASPSRSRLSMSDVERHPRLAEALRKLKPSGTEFEQVLAPFRNVNQLAQAVALCTAQDIALDSLAARMVGPPRRSLRNAVRELKPALEGAAMRKANAAGKQLLGAAPTPRP